MLATLTSSAVIDVAVVVTLRRSVSGLPLLLKGSDEGTAGKGMHDAGLQALSTTHAPAASCAVDDIAATAPAVVEA